MTSTVPLNAVSVLPPVGLGLWKIESPAAADLVRSANEVGYRRLDSACDYGNEAEVGQGFVAALTAKACRRDELRGTSKLLNTHHRRKRLAENLRLFGFQFDPQEIATNSALDRGRRFNDPGVFCEATFRKFLPIYE